MTSHKKMITNIRSFSFGFFKNHNIWSFWKLYLIFEIGAWNFFIFQHWELAFGFLSTIHFNFKMLLSLFPSQILVCATAFAAQNFFFILRFTFGELYCKNIKIKVGRYIGTSLYKYQDFTHSFQDFSHTKKCAYITS